MIGDFDIRQAQIGRELLALSKVLLETSQPVASLRWIGNDLEDITREIYNLADNKANN